VTNIVTNVTAVMIAGSDSKRPFAGSAPCALRGSLCSAPGGGRAAVSAGIGLVVGSQAACGRHLPGVLQEQGTDILALELSHVAGISALSSTLPQLATAREAAVKSTNVSSGQRRLRSSSRLTISPAFSRRATRSRQGCSATLSASRSSGVARAALPQTAELIDQFPAVSAHLPPKPQELIVSQFTITVPG